MANLVILAGPDVGRSFSLQGESTVLGRQNDSAVCLAGKNISRHHAKVLKRGNGYFVEDLASSNGTYVNGERLASYAPVAITDQDQLRVGDYVLGLRTGPPSSITKSEPELVIRESVNATTLQPALLGPDPAARLHTVLEITKHLSRTLDVDELLAKLLEQLMQLFPQADRSMVVLTEKDKLECRAYRTRRPEAEAEQLFSRTIVRKAMDEGVGLLSDDVKKDQRFSPSATLTSLELHSVLCVPLITSDSHRLGVIQVDRTCKGFGFKVDDLQLLTAVALQVTTVLENAAFHAERLREERLLREVALAREIQEGYLPEKLEDCPDDTFEILGRVFPAQQVAGDFYDFFMLPDQRVAFFIGDVSGKGIPAALFMVACRTLCRHLAKEGLPPSTLLLKLNSALADDNPACMFVTLIYGTYDPGTGKMTLTSAGHPAPLLRRADGTVEELPLVGGRLLGYSDTTLHLAEHRLTLEPGEALVFFTDGLIEARLRRSRHLFGGARVFELVRSFDAAASLADWAEQTRSRIEEFLGSQQLSDDLTLLLLRRVAANGGSVVSSRTATD